LPPVSTPLNVPPSATSTRARIVTGTEVVSPLLELTTIDPAESPGVAGAVALRLTVRLWPGPSTSREGETEPNESNGSVATSHGTVPFVPPSAAVSPKMTHRSSGQGSGTGGH
jgi:hypothetical protein